MCRTISIYLSIYLSLSLSIYIYIYTYIPIYTYNATNNNGKNDTAEVHPGVRGPPDISRYTFIHFVVMSFIHFVVSPRKSTLAYEDRQNPYRYLCILHIAIYYCILLYIYIYIHTYYMYYYICVLLLLLLYSIYYPAEVHPGVRGRLLQFFNM